jgi:centromere protein C
MQILGNFYSIENDYDKPARIFFSQGCEVMESAENMNGDA